MINRIQGGNGSGSILRIAIGIAIMALLLVSTAQAQVIIPYLNTGYKYKVVAIDEGAGFEQPGFDDSGFSVGNASFGTRSCSLSAKTDWSLNTDILLRKEFNLPSGAKNLKVSVAIDNDIQVFINGHDISGGLQVREGCAVQDSFIFTASDDILITGNNLLAVRGRDRGEINYVDVQVRADIPTPPTQLPPEIVRTETFREGDMVFFRLFFTDPNDDAEGFGFRGAKGSGWAEETHPFSSPSYGRVSPGQIEYPFNHRCETGPALESDVEAWIYDSAGLISPSVTIHLACEAPTPPIPQPPPAPSKIGEISGTVFDDFNGDGIKNLQQEIPPSQGEPGLADWTIKLISGGKTIDTKVTNEFGNYIFKNVPAGNYEVREIKKNGWDPTKPNRGSYKLKISDGQKMTADFGNLLNVKKQKNKKLPNTFYPGIMWSSKAVDVPQQAWALDASLRKSYEDTDTDNYKIPFSPLSLLVPPPCCGAGGMYDVYAAFNNIGTEKNLLKPNSDGDGKIYNIAFSHSGGTQTLMKKLESGAIEADYAVFIAPALISPEQVKKLVDPANPHKVKKVIIVESEQDALYETEAEFKRKDINHDNAPTVTFLEVPPGFLNNIAKYQPFPVSRFINDNRIDLNKLREKDKFWVGGSDRTKQTLFKDADMIKKSANVKVVEMYEKKDGEMDGNSVHHLLLVKTIEKFLNGDYPFDGTVIGGLRYTH